MHQPALARDPVADEEVEIGDGHAMAPVDDGKARMLRALT